MNTRTSFNRAWPGLRAAVRCFGGDRRGTIAVVTGFAAFALLVAFGLVVDYNRAIDLRARLQNAADFAVLGALNPLNTAADPEAEAERLFRAALSADDAAVLSDVTASVEAVGGGRPHRIRLVFEATMNNALMKLSGFDITRVSGTSSADYGSRQTTRFHILLDTSDSMGLAATDEGRKLMEANTEPDCEFACHRGSELAIARNLGVTLRIDVAKAGVERILQLAEQQRVTDSQFSFAIHSVSTRLADILPLTTDIAAVRTALEDVDIGYGLPSDNANTYFDVALPQAASAFDSMIEPGVMDLVVLTTDGVQSTRWGDEPEVRLIDLEYCDMIKANGRKLAVIYTEYHPIPGDHAYDTAVANFHDDIEPRLRACASSPELFAKGVTPEEIIKAFGSIFTNIVTKKLYLSS
jgi:Flp pilus assembly protein TadG